MVSTYSNIKDAWTESYGKPHGDPHSVFAELLGVERNEAKRICYQYMWSDDGKEVFAIRQFHAAGEETRFVYQFFADMLNKGGLGIAVPPLAEIFKAMDN